MSSENPTGIRNKNYLNVKNGQSPWLDAGGRESGTDSRGHAIFTDPAWGIRAGILLLRVYYFKHNLRTIAEILSRWAPASGTVGDLPDGPQNSPHDYSTFVSARMRIGYNAPLQLFNEDKTVRDISRLKDLFFAMAAFEIGKLGTGPGAQFFKVPEAEFNAGLELVQPGIADRGTRTSGDGAAPTVDPQAGEGMLTLEIKGSVGRWDRGSVNDKEDVVTVQQMLRHAALILDDPRMNPGDDDGLIAQDAARSKTVQAIEAFQRRLFTTPDGVVDVGGRTWRELVRVLEGDDREEDEDDDSRNARKYFFPLAEVPRRDWKEHPRHFGANRPRGRAHAACDLYAPLGTIIYAITDGTVIRGRYPFYAETYAIEVDHGEFIARYGEIQRETFVREGERVRAGQPIARVGLLVGIEVPSPMLHLELYDKSRGAHGRLNVPARVSARAPSGRPFLRRRDIINPAPKLDEWKHNLPGARPTPRERAERLANRVPDSGFFIHLKRVRQERKASEGFGRTIGEYQCYWNGAAIEHLQGQMVERQGPGDNTTEVGDNRDLRIREGAYRLAIHNGVNYKTYGYDEGGTTFEQTPKPGLLLKDTDERSAILIHPGVGYVRSIGCLNPASGLTDADSSIDFMDSRRQVLAIIEAMKSRMRGRFPRSGTIPEAVILIEGEPD